MKLLALPLIIYLWGSILFFAKKSFKTNYMSLKLNTVLAITIFGIVLFRFSNLEISGIMDVVLCMFFSIIPSLISYFIDLRITKSNVGNTYFSFILSYTFGVTSLITICLLLIVGLYTDS